MSTLRIEGVEEIKDNVRKSFSIVEPKRVYVDPSCGLKLLTSEVASRN